MRGTKKKLEDLSVDDIMANGLDSESESDNEEDENDSKHLQEKPSRESKKQRSKEGKASKHKQSLQKLQASDPEFYEFLKNEDQTLLNFADSDVSEDDEDESESDEEGVGEKEIAPLDDEEDVKRKVSEREGKKKKKNVTTFKKEKEMKEDRSKKMKMREDENQQEEDSEEEDFEASGGEEEEWGSEDESEGPTKVTIAMVDEWDAKMQNGSLGAFKDVVRAMTAAVGQIQKQKEKVLQPKFMIKGSGTFNAIVRLCLKRAYPLLQHVLQMDQEVVKKMKLPNTASNWKKVDLVVKAYLIQVMQLMKGVVSPELVAALLHHVHKMIPFVACYPHLAKKMVTSLVEWWSMAKESIGILAFVCLFSLTRHLKNAKLDFILKKMYMGYVRNTRFTSPSTLPVIMFMQHSLTEMFALDTQIAYQHAFVYIRQLAIHLRNAITIKKKDSYKSVYNWQYIHCIHLWCRVLGTLHHDENLQPLVYPLVQTSIGVIKLIPAAKYFPVRFHIIRSLNVLSAATGVFIPLLPLLTEVFDITDFNKKHTSMSFKPFNFAVVLRLSKAQIMEKGFREGVIDQLYDLILEVCNTHCHSIGFPELVLPAVLKMKDFIKTCKVGAFTRQIKQLLDKIQENCKEIEDSRASVTFDITNDAAIKAWEAKRLQDGTAISKFYKSYRAMRERELKIAEEKRAAKKGKQTDDVKTKKTKQGSQDVEEEADLDFDELSQEDSDSEDEQVVGVAERKKAQLDASDDDASDKAESESEEELDGDEDGDKKAEADDIETFKKKKTEIFRSSTDVKDIVEDFVLSDDDEEKPKKKKSAQSKTLKKSGSGGKRKMKEDVPKKKQKLK